MSTPTRELEELNIGGYMDQDRASRGSTHSRGDQGDQRSQGDPEESSSRSSRAGRQSSQADRRSRRPGTSNTSARAVAQQRRRETERQRRAERQAQEQQLHPLAPAPAPGRAQPVLARGDPPETNLIHGNHGITYRGRNLTPRSRVTAEQSLVDPDRFLIEHSRHIHNYVAMQLCRGTASVRIYPPSEAGAHVTCTCELYRRSDGTAVCEHIYWLYARLREGFPGAQPPPVVPTDQESIDQFMAQLYSFINNQIENVPSLLQRGVWDDNAEEEPRDQDDQRNPEDELLLSDIIAFLDKDRIWSKGLDETSPATRIRSGQFNDLPVAGDPLATISNMFRHDRIFRDRLRNAVSRDMCVHDLLAKLQKRAQAVLRQYDRYAAADAPPPPNFVLERANELRDVIERLDEYSERLDDIGNGGASAAFHEGAARLAAIVLREVAVRGGDLFANLIITPPDAIAGTDFVLEFLADIPTPGLAVVAAQLGSLVPRLSERGAPQAYVDHLREILRPAGEEPVGEPPPAGGAGRPGTSRTGAAGQTHDQGRAQGPGRTQGPRQTVPARRTLSGDAAGGRQQKRQQKRSPSK